ncbi:putative GTP-binding protein [Corchorus olitorius]|uniref:GTP-binding protein n=1 Tax=Corchorus olitorius TaxID=93759 RepID=A0A1R3ISQ7_9ROSI|nr:putative GTP-binding protein [Corchorus olitorius]
MLLNSYYGCGSTPRVIVGFNETFVSWTAHVATDCEIKICFAQDHKAISNSSFGCYVKDITTNYSYSSILFALLEKTPPPIPLLIVAATADLDLSQDGIFQQLGRLNNQNICGTGGLYLERRLFCHSREVQVGLFKSPILAFFVFPLGTLAKTFKAIHHSWLPIVSRRNLQAAMVPIVSRRNLPAATATNKNKDAP